MRNVQDYHHLHSTLLDYLDVSPPLGSGEGDDNQCCPHKPKDKPGGAHPLTHACAQPLDENGIANTPDRGGPVRQGPSHEHRESREREQSNQELWRSERHGSLLKTVFDKTNSSSSTTRAGTKNQTRISR